jgi:Ni/Co efflux regulator RcnB
MKKLMSTLVAAAFAATVLTPAAFAQDKKKEQAHKGTPEQGSVQKKDQKKAAKKDGSGKKKAAEPKK